MSAAMGTVERHAFRAFGGAACEILASGSSAGGISAAVADVYAFEERLSRFREDSELSRLNASAGRRMSVSPLLEELLRVSLDAYGRSGGLVNAAVLPQLIAAGYDETIERVRGRAAPAGPPPPRRVPPLPEVLTLGPGWAMVRTGSGIDLGGIGKGWLADRLAERLEDAVVNLGGDLRAVGPGPSGAGWSVALCDASTVAVRNAGVATSGVGGRRWRGGHHLLDPRTGLPACTDVAAVSVVAGDAVTAEVCAKSAVILGTRSGVRAARELGARRCAVVALPAAEDVA